MTNRIVLATGNQGKVRELARMLQPLAIDVVPQSEFAVSEVAETGTTFVENAIIKARHAANLTGLPAMADDSGLVVEALNGAPGVYSSRFAGEHATDSQNVEKLLSDLQGVTEEKRSAFFVCVLVLMQDANDPTPLICQAKWHGKITASADGKSGFGYDPVFLVPDLNCTAAQLDANIKNRLSHRGQALQQMVKLMDSHLA